MKKPFAFHAVVPATQNEKVFSQLVDLIKREKWNTGSRLPSERKLCEILHTSRNTLRRVLAFLEARGNIVVKGGSGSYLVSMEGLVSRDVERNTADDDAIERDKLGIRYIIEPVLFGHVTECIDDDILEDLHQRIVFLSRAIMASDSHSILTIEKDCVQRIITCGGNTIALRIVSLLQPSFALIDRLFHKMSEQDKHDHFATMVELLNALKKNDRDVIESVIRKRIRRFSHLVEKYSCLEPTGDGNVP